MRSIRSSSVIALLFVAVLAVPAGAAQSAAPAYVSSEPGNGEKLHEAPARVEVTFNEPLDDSSDLTVKDSCGRTVDDGNVTVDANTISVGIKLEPSGHYEASYVATGIGGITGSTEGSFHFEVHAGAPCGKSGGGGGHGNHNNNNNNNNQNENENENGGGGHEGHGDGGNDGGSGGDHSSMNHDSGGGSGDHSAATHTAAGNDHSDMRHSGGGGHGNKHGNKKGKGHGGGHGNGNHGNDGAENVSDGGTLAAGEATPFGPPDGTAVMLALGMSLALGVLGGWFLRVSGGR